MKNSIIFLIFSFLVLTLSCISSKERYTYSPNELINIDTLSFDTSTIIKTHIKGYYKIDSNSVIATCCISADLKKEMNFIRNLIESKSTFKLKDDWLNGNDSPSNGIWLTHDNDSTKFYFSINTLEGKLDIHASNVEMVQKGIMFCQKLFINDFQKNTKKDRWLLPRIHLEHNYPH